MVEADLIDNDCDGKIDEEIMNFRDDDNDGKVDEDLMGKRRVDGQWGLWTPWICVPNCTLRAKYRLCNNPIPMYGGEDCVGDSELFDYTECRSICSSPNMRNQATVDGSWGQWSEWHCGLDYTENRQVKTRTCSDPPPKTGGRYCFGYSEDFRPGDCKQYWKVRLEKEKELEEREKKRHTSMWPIYLLLVLPLIISVFFLMDGQWGSWSDWTCTTCNSTQRVRSRLCNNPEPLYGGRYCPGEESQVKVGDCASTCGGAASQIAHQKTDLLDVKLRLSRSIISRARRQGNHTRNHKRYNQNLTVWKCKLSVRASGGFRPTGVLSDWGFVRLGFYPTGVSSDWGFIRLGFCPTGVLSDWGFVRLGLYLTGVSSNWGFIRLGFRPTGVLSDWGFVRLGFCPTGVSSDCAFIRLRSQDWCKKNRVLGEPGLLGRVGCMGVSGGLWARQAKQYSFQKKVRECFEKKELRTSEMCLGEKYQEIPANCLNRCAQKCPLFVYAVVLNVECPSFVYAVVLNVECTSIVYAVVLNVECTSIVYVVVLNVECPSFVYVVVLNVECPLFVYTDYLNVQCPSIVYLNVECPPFKWRSDCQGDCYNCEEDCNKLNGSCVRCKPGFQNPKMSCSDGNDVI
ncbi:hypothetical protein Btru_042459 [Bulinus truncatus]|nr:hypothetical protein Btru_042459 [Bulinus truncatus]